MSQRKSKNQVALAHLTRIMQKLNSTKVPEVVFAEASLEGSVEFVQRLSRSLDQGADAGGINFLLFNPPTDERALSLNLGDVPLKQVVGYIARLAGVKVRVDPHAVVLYGPTRKPKAAAAKSD